MAAVPLAVAAALVALRCQLISDDPYVLGSVSRVIPATRPAFIRALNKTRRLIGCPPAGDVAEPPGQFIGGQCPDVYRVRVQGFPNGIGGGGVTNNANLRVRGPIGGIRKFDDNGVGRVQIFSQNVQTSVVTCGAIAPAGAAWRNVGIGGSAYLPSGTGEITIEVLENCTGPDICGNPPPIYPPPTDFTTNIDITYNIDNGDEVTVTVPFIFAPITANFDGSLRIPVDFSLGGFEFSGDINLPDFNLTINPDLPPGAGEDVDDEGPDEPGETVPPVPPSEKIIGVVVNATDTESDRVSSYSSPGIPPIFAPRLGSVKFAYSIGAATFWSSDIDIKGDRTFIECPFSQGADAVVASPQTGVTLTFTPIRGFPLATTANIPPAT